MKQSSLIALNAVVIWCTTVFQIIPQLILVPFLIKHIGESGYGIYALVWSLIMGFIRLDMSLQSGVIKYTAAFLAEDRRDDVNKVLSSSFIFSIIIGFVSCAAIVSTAVSYHGKSEEMAFSLGIVGIMVLFLLPTTPYTGIIKARQRYYIDSMASLLAQYLVLVTVILWFLYIKASVEALIMIAAGSILLARIVQIPVAYLIVPCLQNHPRYFDWQVFRMILAFGMMIVLSSLCLVINSTGIRWLSGVFVSPIFVAHLAIFLMPSLLLSQIVQALTVTVMPAASAYQATGNSLMLNELFLRATRYTTVLIMAGVIAALLMIKKVLALWVGSQYEFLGVYALITIGGAAILESAGCAHHILKGFGELRKILFSFTLGLVVIPISLFITMFQLMQNPYIAVSAGLALGSTICGFMQIKYCVQVIKADARDLTIQAYIQPLFAGGLILLAALVFIKYTGIDSLMAMTCMAIIAILLYFASFYLIFANPYERQHCKRISLLFMKSIYIKM